MKTIQPILNRLEPWAMFLSILAILFLSSGKGVSWGILVAVGAVRVIRAWGNAGDHFSLEAMGDVLGAGGFLVLVVLLYFFLHGVAPSFVHDRPDLGGLTGEWTLDIDGQRADGRLAVRRSDDDFEVDIRRTATSPLPDVVGRLALSDLIAAAAERFEGALRLRDLRGRLVRSCRASIELDASGTPVAVTLRRGDVVRLHGVVKRR